MTDKQPVAPEKGNELNVHLIRGQQVMFSTHLAEAYGIRQQALHQAIERNIECFPEDSVFRLNTEEFANLKSQIGISSWGGVQIAPYAFTGHGVALLSSVLFDERAIYENQEVRAPTCNCPK